MVKLCDMLVSLPRVPSALYNYNYNINLYNAALQCCPGALNSVTYSKT